MPRTFLQTATLMVSPSNSLRIQDIIIQPSLEVVVFPTLPMKLSYPHNLCLGVLVCILLSRGGVSIFDNTSPHFPKRRRIGGDWRGEVGTRCNSWIPFPRLYGDRTGSARRRTEREAQTIRAPAKKGSKYWHSKTNGRTRWKEGRKEGSVRGVKKKLGMSSAEGVATGRIHLTNGGRGSSYLGAKVPRSDEGPAGPCPVLKHVGVAGVGEGGGHVRTSS